MADESGLDAEVQKHRDLIDDYEQSVRGLYAFAASARWNEQERRLRSGSQLSIPRTMTPDGSQDPGRVTPDGVIQVTERYGVVAEMKKHFREGDHEKYDQIKKYDEDLIGWWTSDERIESHDLVLLTHTFSAVDAKDAYAYWRNQGSSFDRSFAIVEFSHSPQGQDWFFLRRLDGGSLSDSEHDEALRRGKKIADQVYLLLTGKYKFYDDEPPLMHTLVRIQEGVLPFLFSEEDYDRETEGEHPHIKTTVGEVRERLSELYCDPQDDTRQPLLPKASWVRKALDAFVRMGLAVPIGGAGAERQYAVTLKKPRDKDLVVFFARKLLADKKSVTKTAEKTGKSIAGEQAELFPPTVETDEDS